MGKDNDRFAMMLRSVAGRGRERTQGVGRRSSAWRRNGQSSSRNSDWLLDHSARDGAEAQPFTQPCVQAVGVVLASGAQSVRAQYVSLLLMGDFDIMGSISSRETIASGNNIRELDRLRATYGEGRWRKCKGRAQIKWHSDGLIEHAEVHWYEAHGVGAFEHKVKT
jgi:hypothetical protein